MVKQCFVVRLFKCRCSKLILYGLTMGASVVIYKLCMLGSISVVFWGGTVKMMVNRHGVRNLQISMDNVEDSISVDARDRLANSGTYQMHIEHNKTFVDKLAEKGDGDSDHVFLDDEYIGKRNNNDAQELGLQYKNKSRHLPQALIIGVKKAGTRALLEYLRLHPNVRAPGPEIHYFDEHLRKGLEWYRNQMPETERGQLTIEKTPSYFVTKGVPERVYKMSKKTKLIIVFRDPVTRAISDYTQLASRNPNVKSFKELVFSVNKTNIINNSWTIVKIGVYSQHLARWLDYFPLRQIHFVSGENLIHDPAEEIRKIQAFLDLTQFITADNFTFNQTKGFPCYRKDLSLYKWHCLNGEKGRLHLGIDPYVEKRLRDFYRPYNKKLYRMTGHDFKWF